MNEESERRSFSRHHDVGQELLLCTSHMWREYHDGVELDELVGMQYRINIWVNSESADIRGRSLHMPLNSRSVPSWKWLYNWKTWKKTLSNSVLRPEMRGFCCIAAGWAAWIVDVTYLWYSSSPLWTVDAWILIPPIDLNARLPMEYVHNSVTAHGYVTQSYELKRFRNDRGLERLEVGYSQMLTQQVRPSQICNSTRKCTVITKTLLW